MKRYFWLLLLILIFALPQTACGSSGPGPNSWIDRPLDQTHHPLEPVEIMAHASSASGVASFEFTIDGESIYQESVGGSRLEKATTEWVPEEPGVYTVGASAKDKNGNQGSEVTSVIYIGGAGEVPFDAYGDCDGVEHITFIAEPYAIPPGECSLLFWEVIAPEDWPVIVAGEPVPHIGEMPLCVHETTFVDLNIETDTGICSIWEQVIVDEDLFDVFFPEPEIHVQFEGNPPVIDRGECSHLTWEVTPHEGGDNYYQGQPVPPIGEVEVCPEESTLYELIAVRHESESVSFVIIEVLDGDQALESDGITGTPEPGVTVVASSGGATPTKKPKSGGSGSSQKQPTSTTAPAADTTPPKIKKASVSPKDFVYNTNGSCSPTSFKFSVKVSDAGGIASVKLNWTGSGVRSGPVSMNKSGGKYVKSLGQFVNTGKLKGFTITAKDKAGNTSQIKTNWKLDVEECGGGS
jgi:hypothetical protein